MVTETVTVDKSVIIRGLVDEATPGTQMGIIQGTAGVPDGNGAPGSVITVQSGISVTLIGLNIRYGDAANGGGIENAGTLLLAGVTLYQNKATTYGGGISNSGVLTITNSTLADNVLSSAGHGTGIYNTTGGKVTIIHSTLASSPDNIYNQDAASAVTVGSSILEGSGGTQCVNVTSNGFNLVHNGACFTTRPPPICRAIRIRCWECCVITAARR